MTKCPVQAAYIKLHSTSSHSDGQY